MASSPTLEVLGSEPLTNTPTNVLPASDPARLSAPLKVGFVSLGCPKNLVDSEVMMGLLHQGGAQLTAAAEDADIIVVNTCSFIDSAKQESVNTILEMAKHKLAAGGRARKLIVAGCLVERYRDDIIANIPEVDAVVGTGELESILAAAGLTPSGHIADSPFTILTPQQAAQPALAERAPSAVQQHSRPESDGDQITFRAEGDLREQQGRFSRAEWHGAAAALPTFLADEYTPRILSTPRASAYIKIAEGCDHPCTFCIIPQLRGKFRSRRIGSIMAEAQNLIAQGVREITLIGQDTTCYGEDLGLVENGEPVGLAQLLEALAGLEGLRWLRFLYTYPNKVTTRLLETMARHDNIAKYLDVPLQHASAPLLKSMKRGGNAEIFLKLIERARQIVPGIAIRTSFIVGFPGETQADFDILCDFVQAAEIDWLGVFSYSDEEGAQAFTFAPETKVPKRTIEARRRKLMRIQQKISIRTKRAWIGREVDLLVEGPSEETDLLWEGRTILHAPEIDGKVLINDFGPHETLVPGTFYRAEITESHDYDLVARIFE